MNENYYCLKLNHYHHHHHHQKWLNVMYEVDMNDNQIYQYFYGVNTQEEVLMDNELLVEMRSDLVILHNLKLNEEINSFFDII
jgi:ribosomal protein S4